MYTSYELSPTLVSHRPGKLTFSETFTLDVHKKSTRSKWPRRTFGKTALSPNKKGFYSYFVFSQLVRQGDRPAGTDLDGVQVPRQPPQHVFRAHQLRFRETRRRRTAQDARQPCVRTTNVGQPSDRSRAAVDVNQTARLAVRVPDRERNHSAYGVRRQRANGKNPGETSVFFFY